MATLRFELHTFWHRGSGRGDGALADAVVLRSRAGLPYLPGRTIKGLIRAAAQVAADHGVGVDQATIEAWFGSAVVALDPDSRDRELEEARYQTRSGRLRFDDATLGQAWQRWARGADAHGRDLFVRTFASTALGEDGIADDKTLRSVEIAVPMTLHGRLDGLAEGDAERLRALLPLVRSLGSKRNRGLGRVTVTLED